MTIDLRSRAGQTLLAIVLSGAAACAHAPEQQVAAETPPVASAAQAPAAQIPPCSKLTSPATPPKGWTYLPEIAAICDADIFHAVARGKSGGPAQQIEVRTRQNVGILEHAVEVPLDATTKLAWNWNVTTVPSKIAETTPPGHDYLSIAVKFDNGQDLTYMWSATLAPDTGFRCPLPGWDTRETHVVLRSDAKDLGRWLSEKRNILADYTKYVGGKPPAKVTHVWLIANSLFQQGEGAVNFGDIALLSGTKARRTKVF